MLALGKASVNVCLSCGMWAIVTSPKPKPLRINTLIFGDRRPCCQIHPAAPFEDAAALSL